MKQVKIGNKYVGENCPTFIVGDAGLNHNGELEIARKQIDLAVEAGCDAVKFQKRDVESSFSKKILEKPFVDENNPGQTQGDFRKKLELSREEYDELYQHAQKKNIIFLVTPFDKESVDFLEPYNLPAYKIASHNLTNLPLLDYVARKKKPIIISCGMANLEEIEDALKTIRQYQQEIILLQCTSNYPTRYEGMNLRVIPEFAKKYDVIVGYSTHEDGIISQIAAVALGAKLIEVHLTLDRAMKGPDYALSLEPASIKELVRNIRKIELALGKKEKYICDSELASRAEFHRSIVARTNIPSNTVIEESMLTVKCPGTGLPPKLIPEIVGKKTVREIEADAPLDFSMFE